MGGGSLCLGATLWPCGGGGLLFEVVVEGGDLLEGSGERVAVDLFGVDVDAFEECLVEKTALGCVGLEVGGLDVVGEVEGVVEGFEDRLVFDLVALEEFVGGGALAADAGVFFGVDVPPKTPPKRPPRQTPARALASYPNPG